MASTEQIQIWTARLAEAEAAYHQIQIGGAATLIRDPGGRQLQFSSANLATLLAYINRLKALIAGNAGTGLGRIRYVTPD